MPALGELPPAEAAARLREVGADEFAAAIEAAAAAAPASYGIGGLRLRRDRGFRHTTHAVGYLAPAAAPGGGALTITHPGNIDPDTSLAGARVKLTLNGLRVADYPGRGAHRVLFDFAAQNQTAGGGEQVHFNATYRAAEGGRAAVLGRPIFVGLRVGEEGLLLQCATVNVQNEADEAFLAFLETDTFTAGLTLLETAQPALAPLSAMALWLTKAVAGRRRNVAVQKIELGLDFTGVLPGARLAEGACIAVQVPESLRALNACGSAHAGPESTRSPAAAAGELPAQVRAVGALAQEIMDVGVAGVAVVRHNVYADAAEGGLLDRARHVEESFAAADGM
jgi:hypothetical protein